MARERVFFLLPFPPHHHHHHHSREPHGPFPSQQRPHPHTSSSLLAIKRPPSEPPIPSFPSVSEPPHLHRRRGPLSSLYYYPLIYLLFIIFLKALCLPPPFGRNTALRFRLHGTASERTTSSSWPVSAPSWACCRAVGEGDQSYELDEGAKGRGGRAKRLEVLSSGHLELSCAVCW